MAEKEKEDKTSQNNNAPQKDSGTARDITQEQMYEKVINSYKETIVHMKWWISLSIRMGLAFVSIGLVFIIYIGVVKTIEINRWKENADETISTIDEKVKTTLEKIEDKGNEQINDMSRKARVYLDKVYYWHMASKAQEEGNYENAIRFYTKINKLNIKEKGDETAHENGEVNFIITESFQFEAASATAHIPMGQLYIKLYKKESDEQKKKQLIKSAKEQLENGMKIGEGYAYYELAQVYALQNNEDECRKQLKEGEQKGALPARKYAETDPDFASMRDKKWFKVIRWSGE